MNILNIFKKNKKESLLWQSSYLNTTVQVWEKNERRELRFGNKIIQSAFHKMKPQYLVLPYTRFMLLGLIFSPKPLSILHIGLGGGSLVRWLFQEFPNTRQTIIEINSDVIEVAYRFFELPEDKRAEVLSNLELEIISQEYGDEIVLRNVLFDTDSYVLLDRSFQELNILLDYLQSNPSVNIHIEGHTDNVGGRERNLVLSENRAKEVFYYLQERGIPSDRLSFKGYGESKPIDSNKTELGRSNNRRTSFSIVE